MYRNGFPKNPASNPEQNRSRHSYCYVISRFCPGFLAVFPGNSIPSCNIRAKWFIKLFTNEGDTVLDPFAGSGTTLVVAGELNRKAVGIEILPEYFELARSAIEEFDKNTVKQPKLIYAEP